MGSKKTAPPRLGIGRLGLSANGKISCVILFFKSTFVFFQDFFASYVRARDLSSQLYEVVGYCPGRGCL